MEPIWEAAVMDLNEAISLKSLAKARGGTLDTIEGLQALSLPNDTYLVQLGPKTLGGMAPGNRQAVVRWIRDIRKPKPAPLSPYLQRAAVYSDETGSEIIMALDLEGVMSFERVGKYLKGHEKEFDEWQRNEPMPDKLMDVAGVLANIHGIRIGVRVGERQSSVITVDLHADASHIASIAKPLFLQVLSDKGALIEDFESWTVKTKGNEISLAGILSADGQRRLLSLMDSPIRENTVAQAPIVSPGDLPAAEANKSREYFRTIVAMDDDLKKDMKSVKNLASMQLYFNKYAERIERMPILGVDEELVKYSGVVADTLRQCTGSIKKMGIQSGVRQAQVRPGQARKAQSDDGYGNDYSYGGGSSGGFFDPYSDIKVKEAERRIVRAEEKAIAATDIQALREKLISATVDIRRKMTLKYQIEF
jgi:hypothetical protein